MLLDSLADYLTWWIEHKQYQQRIVDMSSHDSLTGLPNRRLLKDRLQQILAHRQVTKSYTAILFVDLDHFKTINDTLGHDLGDLLLKDTAARISSCVRKEDTVAPASAVTNSLSYYIIFRKAKMRELSHKTFWMS